MTNRAERQMKCSKLLLNDMPVQPIIYSSSWNAIQTRSTPLQNTKWHHFITPFLETASKLSQSLSLTSSCKLPMCSATPPPSLQRGWLLSFMHFATELYFSICLTLQIKVQRMTISKRADFSWWCPSVIYHGRRLMVELLNAAWVRLFDIGVDGTASQTHEFAREKKSRYQKQLGNGRDNVLKFKNSIHPFIHLPPLIPPGVAVEGWTRC